MAQTIQIKRSTSSAAPSSSLAAGELAYTSNSDKLFIGHPDGSTGNLVIGSTVPFKAGADTGSDQNSNIQDLLDIVGATTGNTSPAIASDAPITTYVDKSGTTITLAIDHDTSGVTAGSYGSQTAIPVITVDSRGHVTSATTAAISTSWTLVGDDSSSTTVSGGDTLTISATGIDAAAGGSGTADTLTLTLDFAELTNTVFDPANDWLAFVDESDANDATVKDTWADIAALVAGSGITATNGVFALTNDSTFLGSTELTLGDTSGTTTTVDGMEVIHGVDGSGTDVAGTNLTIKAGAGTGAGAGGSILFQTADGTTSGSGVNSFTTAMTIADDGAVTIAGNLTVNGTTTTVNSNTVDIGDNIILLNSDETGTPSQNAGLEVERGTATNVYLRWNETTDLWQVSDNAGTAEDILTDANFETQITTIDGGIF